MPEDYEFFVCDLFNMLRCSAVFIRFTSVFETTGCDPMVNKSDVNNTMSCVLFVEISCLVFGKFEVLKVPTSCHKWRRWR